MLSCVIEPVKKSTFAAIELEAAADKALLDELAFSSSTDDKLRESVVKEVETISSGISARLAEFQGLTSSLSYVCKAFSFGSTRLNVHDDGSDLDLLVVCPRHCSRDHFLQLLAEALAGHSKVQQGSVRPLRDAFVPIVKATWLSTSSRPLSVDILFAIFSTPTLPTHLTARWLLSDEALAAADGADAKSIMALNGVRVNEAIVELLASRGASTRFQSTLRLLRAWASKRGVYGHQMGYLGGIQLTILTALVCLLYPTAGAFRTVERAFHVLSAWRWPTEIRLVSPIPTHELVARCKLSGPIRQYADEQWGQMMRSSSTGSASTPMGATESGPVMPILSPCSPVQNTSYNINTATARVIREEFKRGCSLLSMVAATGQGADGFAAAAQAAVRALLDPVWPSFRSRYPLLCAVSVLRSPACPDVQACEAFAEHVQAKLRLLPAQIEAKCVLSDMSSGLPSARLQCSLYPDPVPEEEVATLLPAVQGQVQVAWLIGCKVVLEAGQEPPKSLQSSLSSSLSAACRGWSSDVVYKGWMGGSLGGIQIGTGQGSVADLVISIVEGA